jgi:hypothetical protein
MTPEQGRNPWTGGAEEFMRLIAPSPARHDAALGVVPGLAGDVAETALPCRHAPSGRHR